MEFPSSCISFYKGVVVIAALLHLLAFQRFLLSAGVNVIFAVPADIAQHAAGKAGLHPVTPFPAQAGDARRDLFMSEHRLYGFHAMLLSAERHVPVPFVFCFDAKAGKREMLVDLKEKRVGDLPHQHRDDVGVAVFISGQADPWLQFVKIVNCEFFHKDLPCVFYYIRHFADYKRSAMT